MLINKTQLFIVGLVLALAVFLGISTIAIWEDGRRFALVEVQHQPAPDAVAAASYLDANRFQWKSADKLHEYAREHRLKLLDSLNKSSTP